VTHGHGRYDERMTNPRRSPRRLRAGLAGLLACAVVALSGCGVLMHADGTVSTANTLDATVVQGMSSDLAGLAGITADDCIAVMDNTPSQGTVDVTGDAPSDYVGCTATFKGVSIDDASKLVQGAGLGAFPSLVTLAGLGAVTPSSLVISREGDRFVVAGNIDMGSQTIPVGLTVDVEVSLTFPGRVLTSNGHISGRTVTWTLKAGGDPSLTATAEATPSILPSSSVSWPLVVAGAAVVVVAVAALVVWRRRAGRAKAQAATPMDGSLATGYPVGVYPATQPVWPSAPVAPPPLAPPVPYPPPGPPPPGPPPVDDEDFWRPPSS